MQKVECSDLTPGLSLQNYKEKIKSLIANDEAFNFINTLKETPTYWKLFGQKF